MENIPRIHDVGHPRRDSENLMEGIQCEPEHFNDRIIFMSMNNDFAWGENGNTENCV